MKKSVWFVGLLAALLILPACEKKEDAPATPQQQVQPAQPMAAPVQPAPAADAPVKDEMAVGEKVYNETCKTCHDAGIAGAPKLGDQDAWADRIAQGMDVLNKNSIEGFTGKTGVMAPKGGNASLTDEEVKAAVVYMVEQSQ